MNFESFSFLTLDIIVPRQIIKTCRQIELASIYTNNTYKNEIFSCLLSLTLHKDKLQNKFDNTNKQTKQSLVPMHTRIILTMMVIETICWAAFVFLLHNFSNVLSKDVSKMGLEKAGKRAIMPGGNVSQSSGAVWESRWPSWAFRPNEPSGFRGRKAILNHAHALVSACP